MTMPTTTTINKQEVESVNADSIMEGRSEWIETCRASYICSSFQKNIQATQPVTS
jgi:hypothetical protein